MYFKRASGVWLCGIDEPLNLCFVNSDFLRLAEDYTRIHGPLFSITATECSDLNNPNNGQVSLSGTTIGSTASYSCDAGYELEGDKTRTCQSNGQWSGREPSCTR